MEPQNETVLCGFFAGFLGWLMGCGSKDGPVAQCTALAEVFEAAVCAG